MAQWRERVDIAFGSISGSYPVTAHVSFVRRIRKVIIANETDVGIDFTVIHTGASSITTHFIQPYTTMILDDSDIQNALAFKGSPTVGSVYVSANYKDAA